MNYFGNLVWKVRWSEKGCVVWVKYTDEIQKAYLSDINVYGTDGGLVKCFTRRRDDVADKVFDGAVKTFL